jgi:hypothetical protein
LAGSAGSDVETLASGTGFAPGEYGEGSFENLGRLSVEHVLRSWFAWLDDRSRIHISPTGHAIEAELQIRRWKTRADMVLFRWRNSDSTRETFEIVRATFALERPTAELELSRKASRPRAVVLSIEAADVMAPAWAMGLAISAFHAAGVATADNFDIRCGAHVMDKATQEVDLIPLNASWANGFSFGGKVGRAIRRLGGW